MQSNTELVRIIDSKLKQSVGIGWSIGNSFTYYLSLITNYLMKVINLVDSEDK